MQFRSLNIHFDNFLLPIFKNQFYGPLISYFMFFSGPRNKTVSFAHMTFESMRCHFFIVVTPLKYLIF